MRSRHRHIRSTPIVFITLLQTVGVLLFMSSCRSREAPSVERAWTTMGTFASVTLRDADAERLTSYRTIAATCFEQVNATLSVWRADSEISRLNNATDMMAVSEMTHEALRAALHYATLTEGAFDPTIAPLVQLWGFSGGTTPSNRPTAAAIADARRRTGYRHLMLADDPPRAGFDRPGISVDLGGIAKGYAVDRVYNHLQIHAPAPVLINLGGNIRCHGAATAQRPWRIGVRNPFEREHIMGFLQLPSGMAVATSGNYERFVTIEGKHYAHIIDPRSGLPVQGMAGVTVLSATATEADAMSTALFVAGIEAAPDLLKKLPDCEALLIPDRRPVEIWVTPGLEAVYTPSPQYANSIRRYRNL